MILRIGDVTYILECRYRATDLSRHITSRGDFELGLSDITCLRDDTALNVSDVKLSRGVLILVHISVMSP